MPEINALVSALPGRRLIAVGILGRTNGRTVRTIRTADGTTGTITPARLPGMLGAVIDALSIEPGQPVTRYSLQRAIAEAATARHGITPYAQRARTADTHTATVALARIPHTGLTHGQYVRRITAEVTR